VSPSRSPSRQRRTGALRVGPAAADAITGINEYTFRSGRQSAQDVATAGTFSMTWTARRSPCSRRTARSARATKRP
jgi:hypothetical protein